MRIPTYKSIYLYLTHQCDSWCSFCYRKGLYERHDINDLGDMFMSVDTAKRIMDFVFTELQIDSQFNFYFWGGEPILNMPVIKYILETYPQFYCHTNMNGKSMDKEKYEYFSNHKNLHFAWSLGNAYEKYGGIRQKIEAEPWAAKLISENINHNVNLMVVEYDKLFDDFKYLVDNLTDKITIDIATRFDHKEEDLERFAEEYYKLIDYYKDDDIIFGRINPAKRSNLWAREFGPKTAVKKYRYCKSGLERLFIDTVGGIWQCDNMYLCQHNRLGDIENGIDYSKLDLAWDILDHPEKYLGKHCGDCELNNDCIRNKCLGLNLEHMGDMFKPEPAWCKMCKVLYKVTEKYVEAEKKRRAKKKTGKIKTYNELVKDWQNEVREKREKYYGC